MKLWIDISRTETTAALFGLPPLDRHLRALAKIRRPTRVTLSGPHPPAGLTLPKGVEFREEDGPAGARLGRYMARTNGETVVALDGESLVDRRLLAFLAQGHSPLAVIAGERGERAGVLRLPPNLADRLPIEAPSVLAVAEALADQGTVRRLAPQEFPTFVPNLRRSVPLRLQSVPHESRSQVERELFQENYKGSTDFLTKWVYPPLVWRLVRLCTRLRIHPNWITLLSLILAFAAIPCFAVGEFWAGLAMAYAMTVLDSVDGKVARLTLTDSAFGNLLDHGLDIVHPPLWYLSWAWGLGAHSPDDPLSQAAFWLCGFYAGDRLVLMLAKARFGRGLHAVTPLDAGVRAWIARRNVNLAIFTAGLLVGWAEAALYAVAAWQGLTLIWHAGRTGWLMTHPPAFSDGNLTEAREGGANAS